MNSRNEIVLKKIIQYADEIGATIEHLKLTHDNFINDYVHISPNAALAGTVSVGEKTHVGIGAVVRNNLEITSDVIIGAGAVVVKNIYEQGIYYGVPARKKDWGFWNEENFNSGEQWYWSI